MDVRGQQADIWKDQLLLEMRVLCKFLPEQCHQIERFIAPVNYMPLNTDQKAIQFRHQRYNMIQQAKRSWLKNLLHAFEIKLQECEEQYQIEFRQLESSLSNHGTSNCSSSLQSINDYLIAETTQLQQTILDKMTSSRRLLLQNRQRSSSSSSSKDLIGVSPEPYLDLLSSPFTQVEWNYLSMGRTTISNVI